MLSVSNELLRTLGVRYGLCDEPARGRDGQNDLAIHKNTLQTWTRRPKTLPHPQKQPIFVDGMLYRGVVEADGGLSGDWPPSACGEGGARGGGVVCGANTARGKGER